MVLKCRKKNATWATKSCSKIASNFLKLLSKFDLKASLTFKLDKKHANSTHTPKGRLFKAWKTLSQGLVIVNIVLQYWYNSLCIIFQQ